MLPEVAQRIRQIVENPENQYAFIEQYLRTRNAAYAAVRGGWVEEFGIEALYIGKEFMKQQYVQDTLYAMQSMQIMQPAEILHELTVIAQSSMEDFVSVDKNGNYRIDLHKAMTLNRLGALKKLKHTKFGLEIELSDKLTALRLLGNHVGLFENNVRIDNWREQAIKELQAGTLSREHLVEAGFDEDTIATLYREAGLTPPEPPLEIPNISVTRKRD